jgi:hypoxanthine phosphoribosyltransferase
MSIRRLLLGWSNWARDCHKMEDLILSTLAIEGLKKEDCVIYAPPRGGLVLGVTLSHTLGIPMILDLGQVHHKRVLFLDDIVDSGAQASVFLEAYPTGLIFAWVLKHNQHINAAKDKTNALIFATDEWVVFPWEKAENWVAEKEQYDTSRQ